MEDQILVMESQDERQRRLRAQSEERRLQRLRDQGYIAVNVGPSRKARRAQAARDRKEWTKRMKAAVKNVEGIY